MANSQGKVYLHRDVCMKKIGRKLASNEIVHHIDGNKKNNDPDNLVIVTKSGHTKIHHPQVRFLKKCSVCGEETLNEKYCSLLCCNSGKRLFDRPTKEELSVLVWTIPSNVLYKKLGLKTDTTLVKWCRDYGISKPPRGFWLKKSK